jgi:hypothetical protein
VWLFPWDSESALFKPTSASSRVWSSSVCVDIAGQYEGAMLTQFTLYFVAGSTGGNSVYRMSADSPYTTTVGKRMWGFCITQSQTRNIHTCTRVLREFDISHGPVSL